MQEASKEIPESKIILSIDKNDLFNEWRSCINDFSDRVRAIKFGNGVLTNDFAWALHKKYSTSITTAHDAKYSDDPDQMYDLVKYSFDRGFNHVSVFALAGAAALTTARLATPEHGNIFAALPNDGRGSIIKGMNNVRKANLADLDAKPIVEIMCNFKFAEEIKCLGDFVVVATGIRLPGQEQNDHPMVVTPRQALEAGADYLAIGRALTSITGADKRKEVFEQILVDTSDV